MLRKSLLLLAALWFPCHPAPSQTLTLTAADAKAVKGTKTVLGVKYTNCYLQDGAASYGLVGSVARARDEKTKRVTASILTLGNGGLGNSGRQTLYTIALSLPATLTKGAYVLKSAADNGLVINPKGSPAEVEYVARLVTVRLTRYDGKTASGEISGTFALAGKAAGQPVLVVLKGVVFTDCEVIN